MMRKFNILYLALLASMSIASQANASKWVFLDNPHNTYLINQDAILKVNDTARFWMGEVFNRDLKLTDGVADSRLMYMQANCRNGELKMLEYVFYKDGHEVNSEVLRTPLIQKNLGLAHKVAVVFACREDLRKDAPRVYDFQNAREMKNFIRDDNEKTNNILNSNRRPSPFEY